MSTPARMFKKKHFRVKHQKVKLFRANEPMLSVLMVKFFFKVVYKKFNTFSHSVVGNKSQHK